MDLFYILVVNRFYMRLVVVSSFFFLGVVSFSKVAKNAVVCISLMF